MMSSNEQRRIELTYILDGSQSSELWDGKSFLLLTVCANVHQVHKPEKTVMS